MHRVVIVVVSLVYWVAALLVVAISQFGDVAGDTHEKFEVAMAARQRNGVILFLVELAVYLGLVFVLRRVGRSTSK